jgi:hypothetical protein
LNEENAKKIWIYIQDSGEELVGKLPPSRNHPKGRNPYAHIAICVKSKFGCTYKEIPDKKFHEVMEFIDHLVENSN